MEIVEVNSKDYLMAISEAYHIFGHSAFNKLNEYKVDEILYLLFKDTKCRLGIIGYFVDGVFKSPVSAPFGGFSYISEDIKLQYLDDAISSLKNWASKKNSTGIEVVLPPTIYNESFISKQSNALYRSGFDMHKIDLNYSFKTSDFTENYKLNIWRNARKSLNISMKSNLKIKICDNQEEKHEVYKIIKENRDFKGFPLKMEWNQILETISLVKADFFMVIDEHDNSIAAAIIFHVSPIAVQVIYWGDRPGFSHVNPMNFISFKIFEYYSDRVDYVDVGPSTDDSMPNFGLCEFKESIGCRVQSKFTFRYSF